MRTSRGAISMGMLSTERSPGLKLGFAILIAMLLTVPLFSVWLLVYDRQQQSEQAKAGISEGWAGPQVIAGPVLAIPYRTTVAESVAVDNKQAVRSREVWQELTLAPESAALSTDVRPQQRKRSIYEVVVYDAKVSGTAHFALPADMSRLGIAPRDLALDRAELRFGISDPKGLDAKPSVIAGDSPLRLQPGGGTKATKGAGFFAWIDAGRLASNPLDVSFVFGFRGNGSVSLAPKAGDTQWKVTSAWPHPSFQGGFLPAEHSMRADGFTAAYRVGNLALGESLVSTVEKPSEQDADAAARGTSQARVSLVQPVDLYSKVDRAAKYGFLFIGFTFMAFLLFDIIGGVAVSGVEYLLVGAALILFFALLLAFAEVIGFAAAYVVASGAIIGLNTAYSAAVLGSWRRAGFIAALLAGLYTILFVLLSLEEYSLLIGSLLLFAALAALMYLTRRIDWGGRREASE
jgi:inner membrane protein